MITHKNASTDCPREESFFRKNIRQGKGTQTLTPTLSDSMLYAVCLLNPRRLLRGSSLPVPSFAAEMCTTAAKYRQSAGDRATDLKGRFLHDQEKGCDKPTDTCSTRTAVAIVRTAVGCFQVNIFKKKKRGQQPSSCVTRNH